MWVEAASIETFYGKPFSSMWVAENSSFECIVVLGILSTVVGPNWKCNTSVSDWLSTLKVSKNLRFYFRVDQDYKECQFRIGVAHYHLRILTYQVRQPPGWKGCQIMFGFGKEKGKCRSLHHVKAWFISFCQTNKSNRLTTTIQAENKK